ncbi:MAG: polysaccharide biosynthesis protein [Polyangiales bacterium]
MSDIVFLLRERHQLDQVIITIATASRSSLRRIIVECDGAGLPVRIIPGLYEILGGRVEVSRIRDVEIEDLLGREPVQLDTKTVAKLLTDSAVLVMCWWSIGSELCRQIAQFRPSRLVLVERSEPSLFNVHRELQHTFPDLDIVPVVADVTDADRSRS